MRIGVMLRTIGERQGIGIYTVNLMREMLRQDKTNDYVLFYRSPDDVGALSDGPRVVEQVIEAPNKAIWDQVMIPRAAHRAGVDVLFHTKFTVPFAARMPTVMTAHGASWFVHPELYSRLDVAYIRAMMPLYCRKAGAILANSDLTRNDYIRILKVDPAKIHTTWLGTNESFRVIADPAVLSAAKARYRLPDRYILSVVKYDPRKNFGNLIAAYRLLRKRSPIDLVVVGIGCEKYGEEYRLNDDGTAKSVHFLGWVPPEDLPALYNQAVCMFFPSVYEEFGIPTCEAMACGCPVVVSSTGALPEITADAGVIVDPFNPAEMAEGLEKVVGDPKFRGELAVKCLKRVREFTWANCAAKTLKVLNQFAPTSEPKSARY